MYASARRPGICEREGAMHRVDSSKARWRKAFGCLGGYITGKRSAD